MSLTKKILITGANGFIGNALATDLLKNNYDVYGTTRSGQSQISLTNCFKASLEAPLSQDILDINFELVIHCAVAIGENEYHLNSRGVQLWSEQLETNCKAQLFFSSISALSDNDTPYAQAKRELEQWCLEKAHTILRPGLVIGEGGLFLRMKKLIKKLPILPLLGGGKANTYFTGIHQIQSFIHLILKDPMKWDTPLNFFQQKPLTLYQVLYEIRKSTNSFCWFFKVPASPVYYIVLFLEKILPRPFFISSSSIRGLQKNDFQYESDFEKLHMPNLEFHQLL